MGTPRIKGLDLFLRRTPLSEDEMITLVGIQAEIMKKGFRNISLHPFGVYLSIRKGNTHRTFEWEKFASEEVSFKEALETQGILIPTHIVFMDETRRAGYRVYCGLTRKGDWVRIVVGFRLDGEDWEVPSSIFMFGTSVREIVRELGVNLREIVHALVGAQEWIYSRKRGQADQAEEILTDMRDLSRLYYRLDEYLKGSSPTSTTD